jgi:PleD family two-component response regulator
VVQVVVLAQQLRRECAQLLKETTLQVQFGGQHFVMASSDYGRQWGACHQAAQIRTHVDYPE